MAGLDKIELKDDAVTDEPVPATGTTYSACCLLIDRLRRTSDEQNIWTESADMMDRDESGGHVGLATVEVDGDLDALVGANEQKHTEDTGRGENDDGTPDLASKTEGTDTLIESPAGTLTPEELQKAVVPLEVSNLAVVTPGAPTEDGELGEHGASHNTVSEKSADDGAVGVINKDGPEDLPVKDYLDATVVPVLRDGLRILAKERPEDPYTFLGDYIKAHREAS